MLNIYVNEFCLPVDETGEQIDDDETLEEACGLLKPYNIYKDFFTECAYLCRNDTDITLSSIVQKLIQNKSGCLTVPSFVDTVKIDNYTIDLWFRTHDKNKVDYNTSAPACVDLEDNDFGNYDVVLDMYQMKYSDCLLKIKLATLCTLSACVNVYNGRKISIGIDTETMDIVATVKLLYNTCIADAYSCTEINNHIFVETQSVDDLNFLLGEYWRVCYDNPSDMTLCSFVQSVERSNCCQILLKNSINHITVADIADTLTYLEMCSAGIDYLPLILTGRKGYEAVNSLFTEISEHMEVYYEDYDFTAELSIEVWVHGEDISDIEQFGSFCYDYAHNNDIYIWNGIKVQFHSNGFPNENAYGYMYQIVFQR